MTSRIFQDEVNASEANKKAKATEERQAWVDRVEEQAFVRSAKDPTSIIGLYDTERQVNRTFQDEVMADEARDSFLNKKGEFTEALEQAYYQHRGELPMSFWMEFTPHELRLFGGGDLDSVASWVEDALAAQQAELAIQAEIDRRWKAAVEGDSNLLGLGRTFSESPLGFFMGDRLQDIKGKDYDALRQSIELQVRGRGDELYEDEIAAFMDSERRLLEMMRAGETLSSESFQRDEGNGEDESYERFYLSNGDPLSEEDHRRFWESEVEFLTRFGELSGGKVDIRSVSDEEFQEILRAREQMLRSQLRSVDSGQLDKILTPGRGPGFIEGAMGAVGTVIDKGLQFGGWVVEHGGVTTWPMRNVTMPALEAIFGSAEDERDATVRQILAETGMPDRERLGEYLNREASIAFEEMAEEDPDMQEEYLRMAGMDPTLALSFFQADLIGQISPEDQTKYLTDLVDQERERLEEVTSTDFTLGDDLLHVLGSYGRNVPGRLSTMFTVMLADEDIQGLAHSGDWTGFLTAANKEAEKFGHTPSASLNIDGSLTGLMLDLGAGIAFDPTTWLFGPRLNARGVQQATKAGATRLAESHLVRRMADDVVEFAQSPSKGPASMYQVADWLDPVSMGEFLNVVDFVPQKLSQSPWRSVKGHSAIEVKTEFLHKLLPDELLESADDVVQDLADDIALNGFKEPLEISVSRADETIWVSDGVKRVLAATKGEISHVPVRLRVTDNASAGTVKVPGYTDDLVADMQRVVDAPEGRTSNTNLDIDSQRFQYNVVQDRITPDTDVPLGSVEHKGATYSVHKHQGPASTRPGVKPDEIWYALDENGELAAFYDNSHLIQAPGAQYRGLLHEVLNTAETAGDSFLPRLMERFLGPNSSFSDDGVRFIKNAVKGRLDKALPQASRSGLPLKPLLAEGESLTKPLKQAGTNGDVVVRPDSVLPRRLLLGDIDYDAVYDIFKRAIVERGAVPSGAQNAAVARHFNAKVRKLVRSNAPGRWLQRYATPRSVTTRFELAGTHAIDKLIDSMYRIWGDDAGKLNVWLERVMLYQKKNSARSMDAARRLSELQPRLQRLQHMKDALGGSPYDEALRFVDDVDLTDKAALRQLVHEEDKALREQLVQLDSETGVVGATEELEEIILSMWDDYNRTYIATNPVWKDLVDETGLVPWEQIGKGKITKSGVDVLEDTGRALPDDMVRAAEEMGIDAEALMQKLSNTQNAKLATTVPVSPLELLLARELGASGYTRATHWSLVSQVREGAMALHRLWTIDKVFTVATAATVSIDELLRIFHIGGAKAATRWGRDRALMMQARAQALLHGKAPTLRRGAEYLSPKGQERLRVLNDYPTYLKQAERNTMEQHGYGWTDIVPGEHGYDDAARQWTAGFLQDTGFRAFLRGPEEFRRWFLSPDGERLRRGTVIDGKGNSLLVDASDDYYQGWKTLFDEVILKEARKAGKYAEVRASWEDIARQIEEGSGLPRDLPEIAINYLGPVRGQRRDIPNKLSVSRMQEGFFDRLFMDPVNYRRGFLADLTRTHEKSRLRSLFASQGKRIVPDAEVEAMLGLQGIAGAQRTGLREAIHEMALKSGIMPESYLDDLVEQAVLKEIENTLYAFDASSRMGAQGRVVFPFGKPWADMAGFWGREMVRKPVLRGWINKSNALWLRSANENGLLSFPLVPNRSSAMLSRLAHTDFTIDKGLVSGEGGLIPGTEETDFSPMFFLPTAGKNPFSYMIPGLGIVPIGFLDYLMGEMYDPVKEPLEYQQLQDNLGQLIPSVHFQQGGFLSRVLGGGSLAKVGGMAVDISGMLGNDSFFNLTSWMGDISREIDRTREISALLADPEELELLLEANTPQQAEALLQALAVTADQRASGAHLSEHAVRFMVPANNRFDASLAEIQDVWIDAAQFESLAHLLPGDPDRMTDEQVRQAANDIRSAFFQLDPWQRDVLVVQQPSLAVNMVGSWEWTPQAINENLEGTDYAYRTGGTPVDLARHEALVKRGLVRPVQPIVRARRILGVIDNAKKSAAKELYTTQVAEVNKLLWEAVPADEKAKLEWVLGTEFAQDWGLQTVEEVWSNWSRIEEDLELAIAADSGVDPVRGASTRKADLTDFDRLRRAVTIADEWKPWGTTFPGLNEEDVSSRFNEWKVIKVDEKTAELAEALGIEMGVGMTGQELYAQVQQLVVQRNEPVFDVVRPDYDRYVAERTVGSGRNMLFEAAQSDLVDIEFRDRIEQYLFKHDLIGQRAETGRITRAEQDQMREEFLFLMHGAKDQKTDWEGIWKEQFARKYGPLDWIPPEPASPFDENGEVAGHVLMPSVRHVVDGDTILIQEYPGSPTLNSVRLLGIRAEEVTGINRERALEQENALKDAIVQGVQNGDNIYLVRDPRFGNTDRYGRMLAWLWIGETPFYFEEDLAPTQDPGGDL